MLFATAWIVLKHILLSEICQPGKTTLYIITYMRNLKHKTNQ